jgi:L-seryl-tRNA(Ser) seleniumtransferase
VLDRDDGYGGGRLGGPTAQLKLLTGAESTLVVNNCAAAVLLALTALAPGREVVVSRGELVEIGGAFRVPDVIASGGAKLVEVGTTNRTRLSDYAKAIRPETALLLRVHPSNYRIVGFVEQVPRADLVELGHARGILVLEDVGAGSLTGGHGEPSVREILQSGVDLVMFSGDKLLGGPQAGLVAGRAEVVAKLKSHPLYRALRVDKVTLAAVEATLGDHAAGRVTPVDGMMAVPVAELDRRANEVAAGLRHRGVACEVADGESFVGGGALPEQGLLSRVVRVAVKDADDTARRLRLGDPPVVARVHQGDLVLDVRTVEPELFEVLAARVADVVRSG